VQIWVSLQMTAPELRRFTQAVPASVAAMMNAPEAWSRRTRIVVFGAGHGCGDELEGPQEP
jgi:hypothetical protein